MTAHKHARVGGAGVIRDQGYSNADLPEVNIYTMLNEALVNKSCNVSEQSLSYMGCFFLVGCLSWV